MSTSILSANDKVIFKSDQHSANISRKQLKFYENKEFCDTVLIAGSECLNIHANRNVLAAMSDYFLETYSDNQSSDSKHGNSVELQEIEARTLKSIVDFMYSGWIEMNLENAESILRAAAFLKIKILLDGCCKFMEKHIDTSNCLKWLILSKQLSLSALKDKSLKHTYTHFEEVSKQKELLMLNEIELKCLLFNENPYGDCEELVFLAMVAWIEYDKSNREHLTFQLLSMVRYQYLTPKFIIEKRKLVCNSAESSELVYSWLEWHFSSETRSIHQKSSVLKQRKSRESWTQTLPSSHSKSNYQQNSVLNPRKMGGKLAVICLELPSYTNFVIQTYDPIFKQWSIEKRIPLSIKKKNFSTIVINEKLIIVGGEINGVRTDSVQCLDLNTYEWSELPPMSEVRKFSSLANFNGDLLVYGGTNFHGYKFDYIELYNFSTNKWSDYKELGRYEMQTDDNSEIVAYNGRLHIVDLCNGVIDSYNVLTKEFTKTDLKCKNLICSGWAVVGGFLYIIGCHEKGVCTNSVKRCILTINDTWCEMRPLPQARKNLNTFVLGNKIIVCGGYPNGKLIEEYNTETNTWSTLSPLLIDMPYFSSVVCYLPS